jgi:hypothetical protein
MSQYYPPTYVLVFTGLPGVVREETEIFVVISVETSNPTSLKKFSNTHKKETLLDPSSRQIIPFNFFILIFKLHFFIWLHPVYVNLSTSDISHHTNLYCISASCSTNINYFINIYVSVTMQHKIVTVTSIFIHDMFRPYTAIIRRPRYAKLAPRTQPKTTTHYKSVVIGLQSKRHEWVSKEN